MAGKFSETWKFGPTFPIRSRNFLDKAQPALMKDIFDFESPLGILGVLAAALCSEGGYMLALLQRRSKSIKEVAE